MCPNELPLLARSHARYCSARCRKRASRARQAIPEALRRRRRWVVADQHKRPLDPRTGRAASVSRPETWTSYGTANASDHGTGLGYVLTPADRIVVVDLDDCIDAAGRLAPWARRILERLPATYVEVSRSGRGLHVFGRGSVPRGRRIRRADAKIEIYSSGRYIAVTGVPFEGAPPLLADLPDLDQILTL